jgi:serine/threonine-protein kinase
VYAATHRFLGDAVAIKLLRDTERMDEFRAEAERTRAITHPAVVRVIDFGRDEASGQCFLVMERVDGETLAARLSRGPLAEADVRRIGAALADGMQAAHDRGIVHRDLKPANVILRDDAPTIVDFGIAKVLGEQSAAQTQRRVGTPPYMAPEQLVSGMISPSVDIWALGALLFEAATGRRPFDGHDEGRCPQLVETAPRARSFAPLSPSLDDLLARCLEREPGRRPPSMSAISLSLRTNDISERHTADLGDGVNFDNLSADPAHSRDVTGDGVNFDNLTGASSVPAHSRSRRRALVIGAAFMLVIAGVVGVLAVTREGDGARAGVEHRDNRDRDDRGQLPASRVAPSPSAIPQSPGAAQGQRPGWDSGSGSDQATDAASRAPASPSRHAPKRTHSSKPTRPPPPHREGLD